MKSSNDLRTSLRAIDHKGYPAYKSLAGSYQFERFILTIDHVQGDPFASPSRFFTDSLDFLLLIWILRTHGSRWQII